MLNGLSFPIFKLRAVKNSYIHSFPHKHCLLCVGNSYTLVLGQELPQLSPSFTLIHPTECSPWLPLVLLCDLGQVLTLSEGLLGFSSLGYLHPWPDMIASPSALRGSCFQQQQNPPHPPLPPTPPHQPCGCFPGLQRGQAQLEAPNPNCSSPEAGQALPLPADHSLDPPPWQFSERDAAGCTGGGAPKPGVWPRLWLKPGGGVEVLLLPSVLF